MTIDIITLFPDQFANVFNFSITKKAQETNSLSINLVDLRQYGLGGYKQVDDTPYGGGAGMVIRADVASSAVNEIRQPNSTVIHFSPRGQLLNQKLVSELSQKEHLVLFNGHYEGVDERFVENYVDIEISLGDYVLSGGEPASIVLVDAISRLLPEVLGNEQSNKEESFSIKDGKGDDQILLEYPHYTKPAEFEGKKIPDVLISGNHAEIKKWRYQKSLEETRIRRPDLLEGQAKGQH